MEVLCETARAGMLTASLFDKPI